jgi:hypothetical protein
VLAERVVIMAHAVSVAELLDQQVVLDIECLDRIYLSGFVNSLQTPGGVIWFLHDHRGMPIASPAVFAQIGDQFRRSVSSFAEANHIPVVRFKSDERKAEVMRPYLEQAAVTGRSQVVAAGVAQEPQIVWTARQRGTDPGKPPQFSFTKENRRVTAYYFCLWDEDFGPAFIKICAWFPYPVKVWVNGHEWAKRQALKAGARVLGEFGDDPDRYASGKARKNCAATSPLTRASGKKKTVMARFIRNDRLTDALMAQALSALGASPGARALYDAERARGTEHNVPCASSPAGSSASSTAASRPAPSTTRQPPGRTGKRPLNLTSPLDT